MLLLHCCYIVQLHLQTAACEGFITILHILKELNIFLGLLGSEFTLCELKSDKYLNAYVAGKNLLLDEPILAEYARYLKLQVIRAETLNFFKTSV